MYVINSRPEPVPISDTLTACMYMYVCLYECVYVNTTAGRSKPAPMSGELTAPMYMHTHLHVYVHMYKMATLSYEN